MNLLNKIWYHNHPLFYLLTPFSSLYRLILSFKHLLYRFNILKATHPPVPTIIIGNLTVGGTGKTPLIILLAQFLLQEGYKPGIVSRGYGGKPLQLPLHVYPNSDPLQAGDEPVLIARKTSCPIVVDPNRVRAARMLLATYDCNVILSDDGLQHTALGRDIEIVVVDGKRQFGNGWCLPAGPLREPLKKLKSVDFIVVRESEAASPSLPDRPLSKLADVREVREGWSRTEAYIDVREDSSTKPTNKFPTTVEFRKKSNTWPMHFISGKPYNLTQPEQVFSLKEEQMLHAVAGIGNPQAFFDQLRSMGFFIIEHAFPDHHRYTPEDINFGSDAIIIMTEKDAIKCEKFAQNNYWCLPVFANCDSMPRLLLSKLNLLKFYGEKPHGKTT